MARKYKIEVYMVTTTDGEVDQRNITEEFSDDENLHVLKSMVIGRHVKDATYAAMEELVSMRPSKGPGKPA